ncbi:MAG TPA: glycosyltransferase family 2 protein [Magnetospirillaceae bacterium]|nr:glycosyltransferase family 2 protein [Magnetospirillaceae bacterium]
MAHLTADILIAAFNEENMIAHTLAGLANQQFALGQHFKVHVVANGCIDNTVVNARRAIAELTPHANLEFTLHELPKPHKMEALQYGLQQATSDIVFCVDADAILDENCIAATLLELKDPKVMVAGPRAFVTIPKNRKDTLLGHMQQLFNIRRDVYEGLRPMGRMIAYRRALFAEYPKNIAGDDTWVAFVAADRYGWDSVRVAQGATAAGYGPQNWIDYLKQDSRFKQVALQLLAQFPEFKRVCDEERAMILAREKELWPQFLSRLKKEGIPAEYVKYMHFWEQMCLENNQFIPEQLISTDGRWEPIRTTKSHS